MEEGLWDPHLQGSPIPVGPRSWHSPPLVSYSLSSPAPTALRPGRLGEQRPGPFAGPSYSRLWPPLEGGAWLKVMPGCLPSRELSTDPQCHLPHRLGEVRFELVPGGCLEAMVDPSVNTLGF